MWKNYDVRDLLQTIVDENSLDEYKADYGEALVTAYAESMASRWGVANNASGQDEKKESNGRRHLLKRRQGSAICDGLCQTNLPIIFRTSVGLWSGATRKSRIIHNGGAKLVNAVSNLSCQSHIDRRRSFGAPLPCAARRASAIHRCGKCATR
jgi:3-methylcrotonyl-CoA carboxylase beta subunit